VLRLPTFTMRPEFNQRDLGKGVRGKYYDDYLFDNNLVLLSPDVAKIFKNERTVNDALRSPAKIARESVNQEENKSVYVLFDMMCAIRGLEYMDWRLIII